MSDDYENFLSFFKAGKMLKEQEAIKNINFNPSGEFLSYSCGSMLKIYDTQELVLKNAITLSADKISYLHKNTVLYTKDTSVMYLSLYDNRQLRQYDNIGESPLSISVDSHNDKFLTVSSKSINYWDLDYKNPIFTLKAFNKIACIGNDDNMVVADYNFVYFYDLRNFSKPVTVKQIKSGFYKNVTFSQDNNSVILSSSNNHLFVDTHGEYISDVAYEKDCEGSNMNESNTFLCGSAKNLYSYKFLDKRRTGHLYNDSFPIFTVRSNPAFPQFLVASDKQIKLYSWQSEDFRY